MDVAIRRPAEFVLKVNAGIISAGVVATALPIVMGKLGRHSGMGRKIRCALAGTALVIATIIADGLNVTPAAAADDRVMCATASGDVAIAACSRAITSGKYKGNDLSRIYTNRGYEYTKKPDKDRAVADLNEAIRLDPNNARAFNNRGVVWDDDDRAIADYSEAIRLKPNEADYYTNRGTQWSAKGDFDRAIADYDQAIKLSPKAAFLYFKRGDAWVDKGDIDRAIADHNEAIRLGPKDPNFYNNRGNAWVYKGDIDRAIADFSTAIRLNPKDPVFYNGRAIAWRDKGDFDRAIADYNEAIRLDPKYAVAYANRGELSRLKGDLERAIADQDQAIRLDPKFMVSYVKRGDTLRYKGEFNRALADYDQALGLESDYIPAFSGRGLTYERMGDLASARVEFEKALASQSWRRSDISKSARDTAVARLAALDSGAPQPAIPASPSSAAKPTSIPTSTAAIPTIAASPFAHQGRRIALVIGNSAYRAVAELPNPKRDAEVVAATLRAIGFETVTVIYDVSREALGSALRAFANEAEKSDWAMIYYAGHGIEVGGVNYLIPVEAKLAVDRDVQFETVPLDQLIASVEQARKLRIIVLDACRGNPFVPQMRRTAAPDAITRADTARVTIGTRSVGRGLGRVNVTGATLVVYSAKHGQTALDGDGASSPFAIALVQRIATPGVEINKLFRLVRDDVMEATAGRQEPYTYGSLPGREDFFFVQR
jgi:tetratricopeptide (TPR) repeat protein